MMITITIIGSLKQEKEIRDASDFAFEVFDAVRAVYIPIFELDSKPLIRIQEKELRQITKSDLVIAVPKPDMTFEESTSYEIAIAHHFNIPVLIWDITKCEED